MACLGVPVAGGAVAAEGVEEVLEDVEGGGGALVRVVVVEEGVGEGWRLLVVAGLWRAGSHGLEEVEAVPGEGGVAWPQVVAGEGGGESRQEEQERRGAVPRAGLWGCVRSHGGAVCAAWVVLGGSLVGLGGGAGGRCAWGAARWPALCGAAAFPSSLSDCSEFLVAFSVLAGGCGILGEVCWWGGRAWGGRDGGRWRCFAGGVLGLGWL